MCLRGCFETFSLSGTLKSPACHCKSHLGFTGCFHGIFTSVGIRVRSHRVFLLHGNVNFKNWKYTKLQNQSWCFGIKELLELRYFKSSCETRVESVSRKESKESWFGFPVTTSFCLPRVGIFSLMAQLFKYVEKHFEMSLSQDHVQKLSINFMAA